MSESSMPKFLKIACAIALASTTAAGCAGTATGADASTTDVPNTREDVGPPPGVVAVDAGIQVGPDSGPVIGIAVGPDN